MLEIFPFCVVSPDSFAFFAEAVFVGFMTLHTLLLLNSGKVHVLSLLNMVNLVYT